MAASPLLAGLFATTLETALGRYLALDPHSPELLAPIVGKLVALRLQPFNAVLYLCPAANRVQVLTEASGEPDVVVSGTPLALAKLGLSNASEQSQSLFAHEVELQGDASTARHFQRLFRKLEIDWQGLLARYTGVTAAGALLGALRSGSAWTRDSADTFKTNLAEFWQEESRELPAPAEADLFFAEVDRLREDRDRLEARIKRLESARNTPPPATT